MEVANRNACRGQAANDKEGRLVRYCVEQGGERRGQMPCLMTAHSMNMNAVSAEMSANEVTGLRFASKYPGQRGRGRGIIQDQLKIGIS